MTVQDYDKIDFSTIGRGTEGEVCLVVSDHLDWDQQEGEHLLILRESCSLAINARRSERHTSKCVAAELHHIRK